MKRGREGARAEGAYLDGVPAFDDGRVKLVTENGDVALVGGRGKEAGQSLFLYYPALPLSSLTRRRGLPAGARP